jgi:predicted CXXCH cytochrome family protein
MSLERTSKSLAERIDAGFHRRPAPLRRVRWRAGLAALLGSLLLLALAVAGSGRRAFQAGPLSTPHRFLANDCRRCHDQAWATAARLVTLDEGHRSVSDQACSQCHTGTLHHGGQLFSRRCAECHREHRGTELARVDDQFCVECHADLRTAAGPSPEFERRIVDFATHPEFAVWRQEPLNRDSKRSAEEPMQDDLPPDARPFGSRFNDAEASIASPAPLRFNHRAHLAPADPRGLLHPDGSRRQLECRACHGADEASGDMQPINFARHCQACHGDTLHFNKTQYPTAAVPHPAPGQNAEVVLGTLREFFTRTRLADAGVSQTPQLRAPTEHLDGNRPESATFTRGLPGQPPTPTLNEADWQWVNQRVAEAERVLFGQADRACRYCHTEVRHEDTGWYVGPPRLPDRWLQHARFRHDRHRMLSCTHCHSQTPSSSATGDLLLPKIAICRECHGASSSTGIHRARADCVECHAYHGRSHSADYVDSLP